MKEEGERNVLKHYIKGKRLKIKRLRESKVDTIRRGTEFFGVCLFESVFG